MSWLRFNYWKEQWSRFVDQSKILPITQSGRKLFSWIRMMMRTVSGRCGTRRLPGLRMETLRLKIPQGDYKILAERFDGMFKSAFYDGDNNGTADIVSITSNITGINFILESRPTATVTIKLLDANTSAPVKYAWFDFFDAEDEFAPIVFPHLEMIDFESDSFDGTYTLSVPGGRYKLELASPEYKEVYQILDESGNTAWETSEWENGATITLTDGTRPIWVPLIWMPPDFLTPNFTDLDGWMKERIYREVPPLLER